MLTVVSELCGLHAQLMSSAELSLWARVEALKRDAVERALWTERTLVKTWAMRGTLHLLPATEYAMWQAALSAYRHYLLPPWLHRFAIGPAELEALVSAVRRALDGRILSREELATEVARLTGSSKLGQKLRHSWGALLKPAAYRGFLCFAPSQGQNVRFTRPDQWLKESRRRAVQPALRDVTRRFLSAYGPVTRDDFAHWWGSSAAQARSLIERLDGDVEEVDIEGTPAWMLAAAVSRAAGAAPRQTVRLLPAFDQYVVGASRHATHLMPGAFKNRVYRPQGWLSPVLLINGRIDGTWRHERKGQRVTVQIEPFVRPPTWARRATEDEAERLAGYLGGRLELRWAAPGPRR